MCVVHGVILHLLGAQLYNTQRLVFLCGTAEHPNHGVWPRYHTVIWFSLMHVTFAVCYMFEAVTLPIDGTLPLDVASKSRK